MMSTMMTAEAGRTFENEDMFGKTANESEEEIRLTKDGMAFPLVDPVAKPKSILEEIREELKTTKPREIPFQLLCEYHHVRVRLQGRELSRLRKLNSRIP